MSGPVNLTAPNPVTNGAFTKALGRVLGRPTLLPTPTPALYLRLGKELARTLLLGGSRVSPTVLEASGYEFTDPELEPALQRMLKG